MKREGKSRKQNFFGWIKALIIALLLALVVHAFIFESTRIFSASMESTVCSGDYVYINKTCYGARFPITILTFPFVKNWYADWIQIPYFRLPGFGDYRRNDIIFFNYPNVSDIPLDKKAAMTSRLAGLPGDTLLIKNKQVYINGVLQPFPENARFRYRIITNGTLLSDSFLTAYGLFEGGIISAVGVYDFLMTRQQADTLETDHSIQRVRMLSEESDRKSFDIFPNGSAFIHNRDNFGPVVIPKKGMKVPVNYKNISLYQRIISVYEDNALEIIDYKVFINEEPVHDYTFTMDYFFVLDDNRDNAHDSRHWGFVPEDHIIGKAAMIWFSKGNKNNKQKDRIFKTIW